MPQEKFAAGNDTKSFKKQQHTKSESSSTEAASNSGASDNAATEEARVAIILKAMHKVKKELVSVVKETFRWHQLAR